jgi:hypothetical protein
LRKRAHLQPANPQGNFHAVGQTGFQTLLSPPSDRLRSRPPHLLPAKSMPLPPTSTISPPIRTRTNPCRCKSAIIPAASPSALTGASKIIRVPSLDSQRLETISAVVIRSSFLTRLRVVRNTDRRVRVFASSHESRSRSQSSTGDSPSRNVARSQWPG